MSIVLKFVVAVIVVAVVAACVITIFVIHGKKTANGNPPQTSSPESDVQENKYHNIGDIYKAVEWLGKSRGEIDVPDEYISAKAIAAVIDFDGDLFGVSAYGTAYFSNNRGGGESIVNSVYYIVNNEDMEKVNEKITEIYGEPYYEQEEPYVESLGGAVFRQKFETDTLKLEITSASKNSYTMLQFTLKDNNS